MGPGIMPSKLLAALLGAIAVFALADLTRAATTYLTSYLAGSAADSASHIAHVPSRSAWRSASGD